jgi:hypothetical protein
LDAQEGAMSYERLEREVLDLNRMLDVARAFTGLRIATHRMLNAPPAERGAFVRELRESACRLLEMNGRIADTDVREANHKFLRWLLEQTHEVTT